MLEIIDKIQDEVSNAIDEIIGNHKGKRIGVLEKETIDGTLNIKIYTEQIPTLSDLIKMKIAEKLKKYGRIELHESNKITVITEEGTPYEIRWTINIRT